MVIVNCIPASCKKPDLKVPKILKNRFLLGVCNLPQIESHVGDQAEDPESDEEDFEEPRLLCRKRYESHINTRRRNHYKKVKILAPLNEEYQTVDATDK